MSVLCFLLAAEANSWDQGFPSYRKKEGRTFCQNQENKGCCEVQGSVLKVPLHPLRVWFWEGRQVEAISSSRYSFYCSLVMFSLGCQYLSLFGLVPHLFWFLSTPFDIWLVLIFYVGLTVQDLWSILVAICEACTEEMLLFYGFWRLKKLMFCWR